MHLIAFPRENESKVRLRKAEERLQHTKNILLVFVRRQYQYLTSHQYLGVSYPELPGTPQYLRVRYGQITGYVQAHSTAVLVPVFYFTVLNCFAVLYCTVLYRTVLYSTVQHCTVPYCTVKYCTVLHCTALYCTVLY